MGVFGKIFGTKSKEQDNNCDNVTNSNDSLEESKKSLENVKKMIDEIRLQVDDFKIQSEAKYAIPICNYHLDELKKLNNTLEKQKEATILESCMRNMFVHLDWFIEQEKEYPNAPWLMVGGASSMMEKLKNRYNERLYLIVKESFENYKLKISSQISEFNKDLETEIIFEEIQYFQGFIEKSASNYQECMDSFKEFHDQVEDLFSK